MTMATYAPGSLTPEDAASLVAMLGNGTTIRYGRKVVWNEGSEDQPAAESYDHVADVCYERAPGNARMAS